MALIKSPMRGLRLCIGARFPDTNGWAYAQFVYHAASDTFTPHGSDAKCGHACHSAVASKDYIFTAYPKR